jgi:hypothetical protein
MGRHKNPQYNRKRLVVAGVAAVTTLGVAVGIGIYGNALADRGRGGNAGSQECLPAPPSVTAPPTTTTTEPPPSDTAPPSATDPTDTGTETAPPSDSNTEAPTQTDQPTDTATETEQPSGSATETSESDAPMNWSSGKLLNMNGYPGGNRPGGGQGGGGNNGGGQPSTTAPSTPAEEGGPAPSETAPAVPPGDAMQNFPGGQQCQDALGPVATDFVDIRKVRPSNVGQQGRQGRGASRGTFTVNCGRNENGHNNSANIIAAPGNVNGAQHTHDYVGNLDNNGLSTNDSLAAAGTTCTNGDKSSYFWPIIRVRNKGSKAVDPLNAHNIGDPLLPSSVTIQFRGNAKGPVTAAPQFLRVLTGNAKSVTQKGANQNAKWTCTGFENRITEKYPLCPRGSQLVRIDDFPGCNDGNTDSANHRTHIAFADAQGNCPAGMKAIPQLRITLKWNVPRGKVFALDAFPDEKHSPITAHDDFINVMGDKLMGQVVNCVNSGRRC